MNRTRILTVTASAATCLGLAVAGAAPAAASSPVLTFKDSAGHVVAKAWYDDLTDNLCAVSYRDGKTITAQIGPSSGSGISRTVVHSGFGKPRSCTGNLSIPEDKSYWMYVKFASQPSKDTTFYT
ncbi:hypothetical protein G7075_08300 [Phycicoccus sp. HDW14]|uniref:hypothetical protein n=1 Tax=Phycicoccus sp. HDW14 TaxID=2714941 RepID=UPI00140886AC|nr:hypothetical protein [Phycicoccus sp. HDW14]QIM21129.1 hypothetical protein G7075_08300 [Phycicoccus sp. HDW14]